MTKEKLNDEILYKCDLCSFRFKQHLPIIKLQI